MSLCRAYGDQEGNDSNRRYYNGIAMKKIYRVGLILLQFCALEQIAALAADFSDTNLNGAHLTNADLRGSNLSGASLTGADLSGTDLTGTNVTQRQLDSACGSGTKLPAGLRIQPCPASTASEADADGSGQHTSADQALPKAHDDRVSSSGILIEVPPIGMRTQDSQQPPERAEVSSKPTIEVSSKAGH